MPASWAITDTFHGWRIFSIFSNNFSSDVNPYPNLIPGIAYVFVKARSKNK